MTLVEPLTLPRVLALVFLLSRLVQYTLVILLQLNQHRVHLPLVFLLSLLGQYTLVIPVESLILQRALVLAFLLLLMA